MGRATVIVIGIIVIALLVVKDDPISANRATVIISINFITWATRITHDLRIDKGAGNALSY